jgi:hypothetical protein
MKKISWRKLLLGALSIFLFLVLVLSVHIYFVTRPKSPDEHTRIMARIDIRQDINEDDAGKITAWLYQQKGIDHVLVNPRSAIVIFTFFPVKATANQIVKDFKLNFPYKADRFVPSAADLQGGCPYSAHSY